MAVRARLPTHVPHYANKSGTNPSKQSNNDNDGREYVKTPEEGGFLFNFVAVFCRSCKKKNATAGLILSFS